MAVLLDGPADGIIMKCNRLLKISEGLCGAEMVSVLITQIVLTISRSSSSVQSTHLLTRTSYVRFTERLNTLMEGMLTAVGRVAQSV